MKFTTNDKLELFKKLFPNGKSSNCINTDDTFSYVR
jgi:hypothetical protein